jgi:hypothetical protein
MFPTECSDVSSNARATPRLVGTSSAVDGSPSAIKGSGFASQNCTGEQAKAWRESELSTRSGCPTMMRTGSGGCGVPSSGSRSTSTKYLC